MQKRINGFRKCKLYNFISYHNLHLFTVDIISIMCGTIVFTELFEKLSLSLYPTIILAVASSILVDILCVKYFYKKSEKLRIERYFLKDRLLNRKVVLYFYN